MAKGSNIKWWVIGGIVLVVLLLLMWIIGAYNNFVTLNQNIDSKWSQVENQYQRQFDLIPNLVSVVSSSVKVETSFVKDVVAARTAWQNSASQLDKEKAGTQMNSGISVLMSAVAENYPTLQANKQYTALTDELSGTQNRITTARTDYIGAIQKYNTAAKTFPSNIIAGMFGFAQRDYYVANGDAMNTPSFGTGQLP